MNNEDVTTIVTMLIEAYPRDVKPGTFKAYCEHLRDLPRSPTFHAARHLIHTSKWLPTIAEIHNLVARDNLPPIPSVDVAWGEAQRLIQRIGFYRTLGNQGSAYVNRTLHLCGSWETVCQEENVWLRKRFAEIYDRVIAEAQEAMQSEGTVPEWLQVTHAKVQGLLTNTAVVTKP